MNYYPLEEANFGFRFKIIEAHERWEYYSIGDIHGCADEANKLIDLIREDASMRNRLPMMIQHGDFIDRGPYFAEAFTSIKDCMGILGNHEHNFVLERMGKPCNSSARKESHAKFEALSEQHQKKLMDRLNGLLNFVVVQFWENDNFKDCILSHSPIKNMYNYRNYSMEYQKGSAGYYCMQSYDIDDERMKKCTPMIETDFVYGHQSWAYTDINEQIARQEGRQARHYNIDSGCVYGGQLTALRLRDRGVLQVQSNVKVDKH